MTAAKSGRKPKSPAFQFYPADYLSSRTIRRLTLEQRGAWLELICSEWLDGPLENDPAELASIVGVSAKEFARLWPGLDRCFELENGKLVNPRLEREREAQAANRERWQKLGQSGNDKQRAQRDSDGGGSEGLDGRVDTPVRDAHGTPTGPRSEGSSSPLSSTPQVIHESPSEIPPVALAPGGGKPPKAPRKPPSGPQADLIRHFEAEWARTRPGVEMVFRTREAVAAAQLVKSPGLGESCRRVTRMLEDTNPWAVSSASLSQLNSSPNRWAADVPRVGARAPEPGSLQDIFGGGAPRPRSIETTGEVIRADFG